MILSRRKVRDTLIVVGILVVENEPHRIYEGRSETVGLLDGQDLPGGSREEPDVSERVRGIVGSFVIEIGTEHAVFIGKLMVDAAGKEVFPDYLVGDIEEGAPLIATTLLRYGEKRK